MQELADLVSNEHFKGQQKAYFEKYCNEFTDEDENKLSYTQIHNEYEEFVEQMLVGSLGEEKLKKIQIGMTDYIATSKKNGQEMK